MSFSVGIVGLPNVGKSTLFKALTKKPVDIAPYPFTTINPNIGIVAVPDKRLEEIAKIIKPEKITPTIIEFVDIAGLVKGAHKGEGLGNQFLANIRNCDAILEIVRSFKDDKVEHVTGEINPERDIEIIKTELLMKDLETIENIISNTERNSKSGDKESIKKLTILKKIKESLSQGKSVKEIDLNEEESNIIKEFQFLTQKPIVYILNADEKTNNTKLKVQHLEINLKWEEEISELSDEEKIELGIKSQLDPHTKRGQDAESVKINEVSPCSGMGVDQIIVACYNILDLITFYTVAGGKETRAWTLKKGAKCPEAGGKVHSDFEEKFIRAEVVPWQKLIESGSWSKNRESGQMKIAGRDYTVNDGDVIEFKI